MIDFLSEVIHSGRRVEFRTYISDIMHTMSEAYTLHTVNFTVCLQYSLQYSLQYARLRVQLQNGMHYVREVVRLLSN